MSTYLTEMDGPASWTFPIENRPVSRRALAGAARVVGSGLAGADSVSAQAGHGSASSSYPTFRQSVHEARGQMLRDSTRWLGRLIFGSGRGATPEL